MTRIVETDHWSLLLPPEWEAERDEDAVLISDRDGVGCLEITALQRDPSSEAAASVTELAGDVPGGLRPCTIAGIAGQAARFEEEGSAVREWYLGDETLLLFITYSCDRAQRGMDDAAVDEILSTLRLAPAQ